MDQDLAGFYETFALASFTVLGLWLVVAEVMRGRQRLTVDWRLGHAISLQLAVLGAISLLAQIDIEDGSVWRVAFAGGGALAAVLVYGRAVRGRTNPLSVPGLTGWALVAVDVAVALVAFVPNQTLADAGSSLSTLELEAVLLSGLILLAVNLGVWLIFEPEAAAD
ncbi:MAG: hypothetical protein ACRD2W_11060 [Acidimicrobiales bacterium]